MIYSKARLLKYVSLWANTAHNIKIRYYISIPNLRSKSLNVSKFQCSRPIPIPWPNELERLDFVFEKTMLDRFKWAKSN